MNIFDARLAVSGGTLHHIGLMLAAEEHRCAWCQADGLRLPRPNESHGICPRHLAEMADQAKELLRGGAVAAQPAHNRQVAGSTPAPVTNVRPRQVQPNARLATVAVGDAAFQPV